MATLSPLLDAAPAVQLHAAAAMISAALGPVALFRQRRDRLHKVTGYTWVAAMAVTALSSFWLHGFRIIGPFSPIHLLSAWTLIALTLGVRHAIAGRIRQHQGMMRGIYFWALGVAGLFTLLPGRIMHRVLFGSDSMMGFALILAAMLLVWLLANRGAWLRGALGFKL